MSRGKTFTHVRFRKGSRRAFTLIELLVVISILVLLMALLFPALSRARKQARAVVCQANLKQWGTIMAMSVNDNDGRFLDLDWGGSRSAYAPGMTTVRSGWGLWELGRRQDAEGISCCPMATKFVAPTDSGASYAGGTFAAWYHSFSPETAPRYPYGSYGFSSHVGWNWRSSNVETSVEKRIWRTIDVRGRARIPALLDSGLEWCMSYWDSCGPSPPECDAIPTVAVRPARPRNAACIDRHNGVVNALFLDFSVRKVGLKELWTLKWHRQFDTAGPWTKAGGAESEDWPQWMRRFKDY